MKPLKIEDPELEKAISSGEYYLEVGKRKFMLFEVEAVTDSNVYHVTNEEEKKQLLKALNEDNPILSNEEITRLLEGN
jgi:hypothetical protein